MLPGFRFLFAAIMLSMSLLVFGLGAAALLRAAHESFASNSSWRAAPEVTFAQRSDSTLPMLATLRVDTPVVEKAPEQASPVASSVETSPAATAPATSEQVAAVKPLDAAPAETSTSESPPPAMRPAENPPSAAQATATADQTTTAAAITPPGAPSGAGERAAAASEPKCTPQSTPAPDQASPAATKIATLGGPPVDITEETISETLPARDKTAMPDQARADQSTIKRRVQAKRAAHRRRLTARARLAIQAQQQQANPFAPSTPAIAAPRQ